MSIDRAFVSTTIPYVNAAPHLGHAFEYVQADCVTRYLRQRGADVWFSTGSDENSLKNVLAADAAGVTTSALVDRNVEVFQRLVSDLGMEVSVFVRTSVDARHTAAASLMWERMVSSGDIYLRQYTGLYCVGCEQFYSPEELLEGCCPEHGTVPDLVEEENFFFRLSRYQDALLDLIARHELRVTPSRRANEIISFVKSGLQDISVSRSAQRARGWGITVPGHPDQVMYVWIDALTNYLSGLGWAGGDDDYAKFWNDAGRRIHAVGKGVSRFHAVYWPAMLLSAGVPTPTDVVVHGYLTLTGSKISKSLGNTVDPLELVATYGLETVRHFLIAEFSSFGDGDFTVERLVGRHNTDLANGLGNLLSRCLTMVHRYRSGIVPERVAEVAGAAEADLAAICAIAPSRVAQAMDGFDVQTASREAWEVVRAANAYLGHVAPWKLAKDPDLTAQLDTCLHDALSALRQAGSLLVPFLPSTAATVLAAVNATGHDAYVGGWDVGVAGSQVAEPTKLFPRLDLDYAGPAA